MNTIVIPRLYCPFPSSISPFAYAVQEHTNEWVRRFQLYPGGEFEGYLDGNYAYLPARFYATAGYPELCLANDLFVALFVMDDLLDHQLEKAPLIQKEDSLQVFIGNIGAIVDDQKIVLPGKGEPALAALTDAWQRLRQISSSEWRIRFAAGLKKMFEMAIWEFHNVKNDQLPTVELYLQLRQYLGAAHIGTDLIEPIGKVHLPEQVLQHTAVRNITEMCRNLVCVANDLFSLNKELAHGDEHNLVPVLKKERNLTLEEAIVQTAEIHDVMMREFITSSNHLPSFDEETDRLLLQYVQALRMQIRGNIDWSESETKRYGTFSDPSPNS